MKVKSVLFFLFSLLVVASLLLASCSENVSPMPTPEPTPTPTPEPPKTHFTPEEEVEIKGIVSKAGKVVPIAEEKDEIISSETEDKGDFR